jgi:hypothetical protein
VLYLSRVIGKSRFCKSELSDQLLKVLCNAEMGGEGQNQLQITMGFQYMYRFGLFIIILQCNICDRIRNDYYLKRDFSNVQYGSVHACVAQNFK